MKTSYTVTWHHAHNFGAMLQSYALQKALMKLGHRNYLIDYEPLGSNHLFKPMSFNKQILNNIVYNYKILSSYKEQKKAFDRFESFCNDYLIQTSKFHSFDELQNKDFKDGICIVGSDQMWNFNYNMDTRRFTFLEFFKNNSKKYSYAVSMGEKYNLSDKDETYFINQISQFNLISVREHSLYDVIENMKFTNVYQNCDPVFLLDVKTWDELAEHSVKYSVDFDYILVYELIASDKLQKTIDAIKNQLNLKVIVITRTFSKLKADKIIKDAGPLEFLWLLKNSKFVITTSFHGTAFSIIYKKNFVVSLTNHAPARILDLLDDFHLGDHVIKNEIDIDNINVRKLSSFDSSENAINTYKKNAIEYLSKM